jgi:hypothetical protein
MPDVDAQEHEAVQFAEAHGIQWSNSEKFWTRNEVVPQAADALRSMFCCQYIS